MSEPAAEPSPEGVMEAHGRRYMVKADGSMTPIETVKEQDLLEDQMVRDLHLKAEALATALSEFKAATFEAIDAFNELVWEKYGKKPAGAKGNQTLATYDGSRRVLVQVADQIRFGTELQVAKDLVMECVHAWAADSRVELVALVENAFRVDKAGQINRGALLSLLRLSIDDPTWKRGMDAIRDSMRVEGTKRYVRLARRRRAEDTWENLSLDLATV